MKRLTVISLVAASMIAGCQNPPSPTPGTAAPHDPLGPAPANPTTGPGMSSITPPPTRGNPDRVLARLKGNPITLEDIETPLLKGYGLNILLNYVQVEMAKQRARAANVTVTEADVANEHDQTLAKMFPGADKAEYATLFAQFLQQQHLSEAEFDMVLETNTYLRKIAEPLTAGKITDDNLKLAFATQYGETVEVRHIECSNLQEIVEAKRRLAAGEPFESVARSMSRNPRSAPLGGELPTFSRQSSKYPQAFKDAAFALKEGDVSDVVSAETGYHLIKLEKRIPPKSVKFEDVKESLRTELQEQVVQTNIKILRGQIAQEAIDSLKIEDSSLAKQYNDRRTAANQQIQDKSDIRKQLDRERQEAIDRAATKPSASNPASGAASMPGTLPATQP